MYWLNSPDCSCATQQKGLRAGETNWLNLLSDVNQTYPELSEVLDELVWPVENLSEVVPPTIPNLSSTMGTTLDSILSTTLNNTLDSNLSSTMGTTLDSILSTTMSTFTNSTMVTPDSRTAMRGYRLGWCLEIFDLETNISTLTCSSSLMAPICVLMVILLCSAAMGFLCAMRERAGRQTGEGI